MIHLFDPLKIRDITFRNRIFVSPMCQYSAQDGVPNDWHLVHLGSRASGGAGLVIAEATGVSPEGRISVGCLGLWNDEQEENFKRITSFIKSQGSVPGIQLAHAGRKASADLAWKGGKILPSSQGGWQVVGPSPLPFSPSSPVPKKLAPSEIEELISSFVRSADRALRAGFEVIELHMAHGYLMHQFLSPLSNLRDDEYGGSLQNRMRLPLSVAREVRKTIPKELPLFVRISATDWADDGWDLEQSLVLCAELKSLGVDFIDVSTGGTVPDAKIPVAPLFQVPFAEAIKKKVGIATGAVGLITSAQEAEDILLEDKADAVLIAREFLRDPYWPIKAAQELGAPLPLQPQYLKAY